MKYDRPVWQLMHACADALTETFRLDDVRSWFAENYPEVGDATIRAHVVGLTDGGAKHPQFQRRSPLFRRVSRGVYAPIPFDERGELPEDNPDDEAVTPTRFGLRGPLEDDVEQDRADDADLEPAGASLTDDDDDASGDADVDLGPRDDSAGEFWHFPVAKQSQGDAMAKAAAARRKKQEKDERRRLKAAKREDAAQIAAELARTAHEQIETERVAAARAEASRLQAERVEAEQEAARERKRVSKLRKAARKERERAELLEREEDERRARRGAERTARESAEQHLLEAAARRDREEQDRLERVERDRVEFERAEQERRAFEEDAAREEREREQLEREEQQLQMTLRPMVEPPREAAARPEIAPSAPESGAPTADDFSSPGGIVIVRAPRAQTGEDTRPSAPPVDPVVEAEPEPEQSEQSEDSETQSPPFDVEGEDARPSDAIVLGSVGPRLAVPAPARDAFRDMAFQRARRDAELSGSRWFVLSAEHGLLEPQEWMSPDERAMTDIEPRHREAWATWVVARLEMLVGELPGQIVQVAAPGPIATPVLAALQAAGAETTEGPIVPMDSADPELVREIPIDQDNLVEEVPLTEDPAADDVVEEVPVQAVPTPSVADDRPDAQVIPFVSPSLIAEHLADPRQSIPAAAAAALPQRPGIYAWSVDHAGSRDLNRALRLPVRAGVIYVGQVGGSSGLSDSNSGIYEHVTRVQLHGRARSSTFRRTLATSLATFLGLHTIDDPRLNEWMLEHLTIAAWPSDDVTRLRELRSSVVEELLPALNVDRRHSGEYRDRLAELGGRLA